MAQTVRMYPIVFEAAKKAAVAWLTVPGAGPAYPVWCLWIDDALYVVTGSGEQATPGLPLAPAGLPGPAGPVGGSAVVAVTLRGDHGGRVVTWPAEATIVDAADPAWGQVAPALAAKRLNAPGGPQRTAQRWADECRIIRLRPAGEPAEAGPSLPQASLAAPVPPTPAAHRPRTPFRLHRVRRP